MDMPEAPMTVLQGMIADAHAIRQTHADISFWVVVSGNRVRVYDISASTQTLHLSEDFSIGEEAESES